ncbi:MAG: hypothetical protein ACP5O3_01700 [Candidatus Micrarchaeia archaeon]|jgi:uncharacterized protein YccT (UPF0319 family)
MLGAPVLFGEFVFDLWFVVKVIVFSYLLFQLYLMFRDTQLIFGLASLVAAYFIFVHGVSTVVLVAVFFLFVVFGSQLQMLVMFGLEPILGLFGIGSHAAQLEANELARLQDKIAKGEALSAEEEEWFQSHMQHNEAMQQNLENYQQNAARARGLRMH